MRNIDRRNAWSAALITFAGALATGAMIGIVSLAGERAAWAQTGPGSAPACRPGVRPGAEAGKGNGGSISYGFYQMRLCGERGRLTFTTGGAPYVWEIASTLNYFSPPVIAAPNDWFDYYMWKKLCDAVPAVSDLPGAKLTIRFISYTSTTDVSTTITLSPDTEKPTLKTTSTPDRGTPRKPGDTITVRMEASEEYGHTRSGWQTGVKKIQLIDESQNQVVLPYFENGGRPRPCDDKLWKQALQVTYRVPETPLPVIRLRAVAEDFAGNKDFDIAEFPIDNERGEPARDANAPPTGGGSGGSGGRRQRRGCEDLIVRGKNLGKWCP